MAQLGSSLPWFPCVRFMHKVALVVSLAANKRTNDLEVLFAPNPFLAMSERRTKKLNIGPPMALRPKEGYTSTASSIPGHVLPPLRHIRPRTVSSPSLDRSSQTRSHHERIAQPWPANVTEGGSKVTRHDSDVDAGPMSTTKGYTLLPKRDQRSLNTGLATSERSCDDRNSGGQQAGRSHHNQLPTAEGTWPRRRGPSRDMSQCGAKAETVVHSQETKGKTDFQDRLRLTLNICSRNSGHAAKTRQSKARTQEDREVRFGLLI